MLREDHPFGQPVHQAVVMPAKVRPTAMLAQQRGDVLLDQTEMPTVKSPKNMAAAGSLEPQRKAEVTVAHRIGGPVEGPGVPFPLPDETALSADNPARRE